MANRRTVVPPPTIADADELIDEIIAMKGPYKYTDGLNEDNWEDEIEKIPLFMTKSPDPDLVNKSPGLAALQAIKYQENTPEGRASVLKEDGNHCFKEKKYKKAVDLYTRAIEEKCIDPLVNAVLYCNRAAGHYHLGNYRSSINDASKCLEFKEDHIKAHIRGAEANAKLCKYTEALDWCERGIKVDPLCKKLVELKKVMTLEKKKQERDERKQKVVDKKSEQKRKLLIEAIKSRGILHAHSSDDISSSHCSNEEDMDYIIDGPHPTISGVHFDDEGFLVWPVIFLYPEYGQTDLVQSFHENNKEYIKLSRLVLIIEKKRTESKFNDIIDAMFSETPDWDAEKKYTVDRIEVWYEDFSTNTYMQVDVQSTLAGIIYEKSSRCYIISGAPSFILLSNGSKFKEQFLNR